MSPALHHESPRAGPLLGLAGEVEPDTGVHRHGDPQFMTSLARGLLVIQAFSGPRRGRTIAEISRITGISRAAARRCLYTLCELGYAACEGRVYRLLPKVLGLGHGPLLASGIAQSSALTERLRTLRR